MEKTTTKVMGKKNIYILKTNKLANPPKQIKWEAGQPWR